jgi:predicted protein tyrosine phosphatase
MYNNEISKITDNIFISGINPINPVELKKHNIEWIVCCVDRKYVSHIHADFLNNSNITIIYLPYDDIVQQNLWERNNNHVYIHNGEHLEQLYKSKYMIDIGGHFIKHAIQNNKKVLCHCMAGISRSVSVVTYFLMKEHGMTFANAFSSVRAKRAIANPNKSFILQLKEYDIKRSYFTDKDANVIVKKNK